MTKRAGSGFGAKSFGSVSQWYGSANPDPGPNPNLNVTDPQPELVIAKICKMLDSKCYKFF